MLRINNDIKGFCQEQDTRDGSAAILSILLENIRDIDRNIGKRTLYIAVLIGGFELLKRASVGEITVLGIQLTEFSIAEKILPVIIAYLNMSCWSLTVMRRLSEDVFDTFIECLYPSLWASDLEHYLRPPHFIKTYQVLMSENEGLYRSILKISTLPVIIILGFTVPVFTLYAGYSLIAKYGFNDALSIVSIILSALLIFQMFLLTTTANKAVKDAD